VNYSETLGSVSGGQSSRQNSLTAAASKLYSQVKKMPAHGSSRSALKLFPRTNDMKRLLDIFIPGVKRTFLQLGAIAVATGLHAEDGSELMAQDMQAGGGYSKSIEGVAMQKLCAATKGQAQKFWND
jgi:hypothetical protein